MGARGAVLVSGGAGYVGSHIVLALCDAGYRVAAVDDLSTGNRDAVPAAVGRHGVVAAVHAAAALADTPEAAQGNRRMCEGFVRACAGAGVRRLVLTSSAAVYGAIVRSNLAWARRLNGRGGAS